MNLMKLFVKKRQKKLVINLVNLESRDNMKIRVERLKGAYKLLSESCDCKDTIKVNLKLVKEILAELEEKNENIYVSGQGIDFNIAELQEMKKMYSRALTLLKNELVGE